MNLGAMMAGGHSKGRQPHDFYPTPDEATHALLRAEHPHLAGRTVWEPACGDGAMLRVLEAWRLPCVGTDIRATGVGRQADFLQTTRLLGDAIVTNPPFRCAAEFIQHALFVLEVDYLALLLKSTFFHAANRLPLFRNHPPSVVYPLTWRIDFLGLGRPTMEVMWVVWDVRRAGTKYEPLARLANQVAHQSPICSFLDTETDCALQRIL